MQRSPPYTHATQSAVVVLAHVLGSVPVASAVGGIPEQIANGIDGILVERDSGIDAWRRALGDLARRRLPQGTCASGRNARLGRPCRLCGEDRRVVAVTVNVSAVMTVLDEPTDRVARALASLAAQQGRGPLEVIIAAPSRAASPTVVLKCGGAVATIVLVGNPGGERSLGLNRAIGVASAPFIVRVDCSVGAPAGVHRKVCRAPIGGSGRRCRRRDPATAGTRSTAARAAGIARALRNPWVLGGARYRRPGSQGPADTVYLGVFHRQELLETPLRLDARVERGLRPVRAVASRRTPGLARARARGRATRRARLIARFGPSTARSARPRFATGAGQASVPVSVKRCPWSRPRRSDCGAHAIVAPSPRRWPRGRGRGRASAWSITLRIPANDGHASARTRSSPLPASGARGFPASRRRPRG